MAAKSKHDNKKSLYRSVNTRTHHVRHGHGGDYRHARNTADVANTKMSQGKRRGLDYSPLYRFLLAKVGSDWDSLYSEIVPRVEDVDAIFHMVAKRKDEATAFVRLGESSYYSGLYVDDTGVLRIYAPEIDETSLEPSCSCCTHTFNGIPFERKA